MSDFLFRAIGCAVNTAAWAANGLLEQMYPREDPAHIWDDSPREGVEAAPAEAAGADDAAGVVPPTPAASLTWQGWAVPAIVDVLGEAIEGAVGIDPGEWADWCEVIAPKIADRIACDPNRAVLALTSLQKQ